MGTPTRLNKRRCKRLDIVLDVAVHIDADDEKTGLPENLTASCRNLSMQGLCLETSLLADGAVKLLSGRPGERDYTLTLEIMLQPQDAPFRAIGEVCWYSVDHNAQDFIYQLGVEFVDISPAARRMLRRFIKKHCRSSNPLAFVKSLFTRN
jgi:c-di-GMP-binding flagellar brake protein YcgR